MKASVSETASGTSDAPALGAVCGAVKRAGGWIPFDEYLGIVLHDPQCGFYGAGRVRFGVGGDFATAPNLSPLFAECVAAQIGDVLRETGGGVLELGAGDGGLAAELARAMGRDGPAPKYEILETSAALRERQRECLRESGGNFHWRETLPESFCGVVFANETLDAIPFRLFTLRNGKWMERGVVVSEDSETGLGFADRDAVADAAVERLRETDLPEGCVVEVNPRAEALVRSLAERIARGGLLIADYGCGRGALYHPVRAGGTMMCCRNGRSDSLPLECPGAKDITAHVDFTAMAEAGMGGGCDLIGFATQERFLVNCGVLELLAERRERLGDADYAAAAAGAHKILGAQEMGEIVKFMSWGRGVSMPLRGFEEGDLRHRL